MIYYNEKDLFAYFANTLVGSVYYGETLIYGPPTSTDDALIVITPDSQGLILKQGLPIQYEDYTTGETGTEVLSSDIEIPNLTEAVYDGYFYWDPPSMVNTSYGTYIKPTGTNMSGTNFKDAFTSATGLTPNVFGGALYPSNTWELNNNYYYNGTNSSTISGDTVTTPGYGSTKDLGSVYVSVCSFAINNLDTSSDYHFNLTTYIDGINLSEATYNTDPVVYVVDVTNGSTIYQGTRTSVLGKDVYITFTYRPTASSTKFAVYYYWDSVTLGYNGSSSTLRPSKSTIYYPKVAVRQLSYTYNYNKVYTLSLDAYKFDPEYPVNINLTYRETDTPIATYKVNEDNVVYDLELI